MPKYYGFKVYGYYLYFTSHCVVEAMHAHASDTRLSERGSAKFFVRADGSSEVAERGRLTDRELVGIREFIRCNYRDMYMRWSEYSDQGFYRA
ncbi:MAG: DUF4160 domain-containing protein [Kiritimatiellae bacterium]|nr:DUF4160 domain-containing protein [Kiritimatiellia bacterium]